jgi:uncharacterized protein YjaZ
METKKIEIPLNEETLNVDVISFLDSSDKLENKNEFVSSVCSELRKLNEEDHFGGFLGEEEFNSYLKEFLFKHKDYLDKFPLEKIGFEKVVNLVEDVFEKISKIFGKREFRIYIFPINLSKELKSMGGVTGMIAWEDMIHIFIYPLENWEIEFKSTLLHELAHCMQEYYVYEMDLFDHLIADGLAEHFQEKILDGKRNSFTKVVSKEEAKNIFKSVIPLMNKKMDDDSEPDIHKDLFFGSKEYLPGTGYTIGYYLVEDWLKNKDKIYWKEIFKINPSLIKEELKYWFG